MIRMVTLVLLTISDIDVSLGFLFMYNVAQRMTQPDSFDIIDLVALCLCLLGMVTYTLGICVLGPKQKFKVAHIVRDAMENGSNEFNSKKFRTLHGRMVGETDRDFSHPEAESVRVTLASPVFPNSNGGRHQTFLDLDLDDEGDRNRFRDGMMAWGIGTLWEAAQVNNQKNCLDRAHGTPLWRLAAFGFMALPSPKDLGGILNANALYSFAVGTFLLAFGLMMLFTGGFTLMTILPLITSSVSFALSLANVIFDFSATLTQLALEMRKADAIKNRIAQSQSDSRERLTAQKDRDVAEIRRKYAGGDAASLVKKQTEIREVNAQYASELQLLSDTMITEMRVEIESWQNEMAEERDLLQGKAQRRNQDKHATNAVEEARRDLKVFSDMRESIITDFREQFSALDHTDPEFATNMREMIEGRDRKLQALAGLNNTSRIPTGSLPTLLDPVAPV